MKTLHLHQNIYVSSSWRY